MDRSKQGTKRSLLVEGGGVPIGLSVAGANRNDFKLLEATLQSIPVARPKPTKRHPQHACLDSSALRASRPRCPLTLGWNSA